MGEPKHTAEPWWWNGIEVLAGNDATLKRVCAIVKSPDCSDTEFEANGKLIAAAPKLLASCREVQVLFANIMRGAIGCDKHTFIGVNARLACAIRTTLL